MHRIASCFLLLFFLSGAAAAPTVAAADAIPVTQCTRECDPIENNGGTHRGDEPIALTLYGHMEDILGMAPLNAQPPDPKHERDVARVFMMPTLSTHTGACVTSLCLDPSFDTARFTFFSSGRVEFTDSGWSTHQEPGLAAPLVIVDHDIRLYWYMSANTLPPNTQGVTQGLDAAAMPQVDVYARLETGRFFGKGTLIAETPASSALGSSERVNMVSVPGSPSVYEFLVRLKVVTPVVPDSTEANGFILTVLPYQVNSGAAHVASPHWSVHAGAQYPPRIVVKAEPTLHSAAASRTVYQGGLFFRWAVLPALGSYDLDDASLALRQTRGPRVDPDLLDFIVLRRSVDCGGQFKPVNATWRLDLAAADLADGAYEFTASVTNLQGTYLLSQPYAFRVLNGTAQVPGITEFHGAAKLPAPGPASLLFLLAAAAASASRLRRPPTG